MRLVVDQFTIPALAPCGSLAINTNGGEPICANSVVSVLRRPAATFYRPFELVIEFRGACFQRANF